MNVLSVPVEVIDTSLLPYLGWNDLLRLRRTCRKFKGLTENYMRRHPEMAPEMEINEKERNFRAFLVMGIPSKRIFLNNQSGNQFYCRAPATASQFLEDYGPMVTHLRMDKFSVCCTAKGKQFLEGFPNLVSFEAAQTALKRGGFGENPGRNKTNLPTVFERLQVLKLSQAKPDIRSGVSEVLEELLRRCSSLEHFCIPFPTHWDVYGYSLHEDGLTEFFRGLSWTIGQRNGEAGAGVQAPLSRIQTIEFSDFPQRFTRSGGIRFGQRGPFNFIELNSDYAQEAFHRLASICAENNIKLVNVRGQWLSEELLQDREFNIQLRQPGTPLVSLTSDNFPAYLTRYPLSMPNLETLKLRSLGARRNLRGVSSPCNLPMLKSLDLTFYSGDQDSEAMSRYFFEGVVHPELTELHLAIWMGAEFERDFVGGLADLLVASCPRLKKLTINGLEGNCEALVAILERFETLEEIDFIGCRGLKNADFVGPDAENPRFLRLTGLRKLSFLRLDIMPNLSDVLFSAVIRHMRLTQLKITASRPIRSVTLQGIESLLEGLFSESIEKFFEGWSLDHVSPEEFQALGKKFRCKNIV